MIQYWKRAMKKVHRYQKCQASLRVHDCKILNIWISKSRWIHRLAFLLHAIANYCLIFYLPKSYSVWVFAYLFYKNILLWNVFPSQNAKCFIDQHCFSALIMRETFFQDTHLAYNKLGYWPYKSSIHSSFTFGWG